DSVSGPTSRTTSSSTHEVPAVACGRESRDPTFSGITAASHRGDRTWCTPEPGSPMDHIPPIEARYRELAILNTIATALNESTNLSDALGTVLSQVAELLSLRTGWIWLLDESSG